MARVDVTETKVRFANGDGQQLAGVLVEPKEWAAAAPRRVIVLLHGLMQHKNIAMLKPFATRLAADAGVGCATFRFDFRGLGESEGATRFTPHFDNLRDLRAAVAYIEKEHRLQVHCIFGYSAGGDVSTMYAAENPGKVPYMSVHSPRWDASGIRNTLSAEQLTALQSSGAFEQRFSKRGQQQLIRVDRAELERFESLDFPAFCRAVPASTRVLVTHGLADDRVPATDSAVASSNFANVTQRLFAGVKHDYKEPGNAAHDDLYRVFRAWLLGGADESTEWRRRAFAKL